MPVLRSLWNSHAHVLAFAPRQGPAFYWGPGQGAEAFTSQPGVRAARRRGRHADDRVGRQPRVARLGVLRRDRAALPACARAGRSRSSASAADATSWRRSGASSPSITGVEINDNVIALLDTHHRRFTRLADHPGVRLVHDEGRAFLTRTRDRFDVIQMSLVDTWAATGAGAFTLSENGLYTREAWRIFLDRLTPTGVLSVSRWFSPAARLGDEPAAGAGGRARCSIAAWTGRSTHLALVVAPQRGHAAGVGVAAVRADDLAHRGSHQPGARVHRPRRRRSSPRPMRGSPRSCGSRSMAELAVATADDRSTTIGRPPTRGRSSSTWCGPRPGGAPAP